MSKSIELSDAVYGSLERAAGSAGLTPSEWIARQVQETGEHQTNGTNRTHGQQKLSKELLNRIGRIVGRPGTESLSNDAGHHFTEMLQRKHEENSQ